LNRNPFIFNSPDSYTELGHNRFGSPHLQILHEQLCMPEFLISLHYWSTNFYRYRK